MIHTASVLLVILFQIIEDKKSLKSGSSREKSKVNDSSSSESKTWCPANSGPMEANLGLEQLFVFLGHFCLGNQGNQDSVVCGTPPSLLLRLCRMPIRYLTDER